MANNPKVTIVGAGLAGMTAALRLLQQGFKVTLIERDTSIGGKWRAIQKPKTKFEDYHEHSYHFFCNWFINFWELVDDLGLRENFEPRTTYKVLRQGEYPRTIDITNVGDPRCAMSNLLSGLAPIPDMFLYNYSMIDLLAERFDRERFTDILSVNGWSRSRPYMTDRSAELHDLVMAKAFALPIFRTSAASYKKFNQFCHRLPAPQAWVLKGNSQEFFHSYLLKVLEKFNKSKCLFGLRLAETVTGLELDNGAKVTHLYIRKQPPDNKTLSPSEYESFNMSVPPNLQRFKGRFKNFPLELEREGAPQSELRRVGNFEYETENSEDENDNLKDEKEELCGDLILAVPPRALSYLADENVVRADPQLGRVRQITSWPMASLSLFFKKKIEHMPKEHITLFHSMFDLTFVDNSQLWPEYNSANITVLNVVASNPAPILFTNIYQERQKRRTSKIMIEIIVNELHKYFPFDDDDVDAERSEFQLNIGETLFINEVGSWDHRPTARTQIGNLFIAGDYCKTCIDIVTLESAVVSGLMAAEEVRRRIEIGSEIKIVEPESFPSSYYQYLKWMLAPYAYWAKVWSIANDQFRAN